jgi:hypothetical protein
MASDLDANTDTRKGKADGDSGAHMDLKRKSFEINDGNDGKKKKQKKQKKRKEMNLTKKSAQK